MINNDKQPLVSIIVPMYNAEKYIAETIESVINQTYKNWELLIVDDCSTDSSRDIVRKYINKDNRIKLIESETNFGGPARPRNIGIEHAKGDYIAFLDADDVWFPEKTEKQLYFMQKYDLNFSSTSIIKINNNSKLIKTKNSFSDKVDKLTKHKKNIIKNLIRWNFIIISSVIIKKKSLIKFDEDVKLIGVEDYDLWLRLLSKNNIKYMFYNKELVCYRILNNSLSHTNYLYQQAKASYCILKYILDTNKSEYYKIFLERNMKTFFRILFNKYEK